LKTGQAKVLTDDLIVKLAVEAYTQLRFEGFMREDRSPEGCLKCKMKWKRVRSMKGSELEENLNFISKIPNIYFPSHFCIFLPDLQPIAKISKCFFL